MVTSPDYKLIDYVVICEQILYCAVLRYLYLPFYISSAVLTKVTRKFHFYTKTCREKQKFWRYNFCPFAICSLTYIFKATIYRFTFKACLKTRFR